MNMSESRLRSLFSVWSKLQEKPSSASSDLPKLKKLNQLVYEVYTPLPKEEPDLEVVFFHGLQPKSSEQAHITTWMSDDNSQFWLQTWLVELFPKARILTISIPYEAVSSERRHDFGLLDRYSTGESFVYSLTSDLVGVVRPGCPVVLVGHCLGGLVLKELCVSARWLEEGSWSIDRSERQRIKDFVSNLRGMFFYGTPHIGLLGDRMDDCFKGSLFAELENLKVTSARRNEEFGFLRSTHGWFTCGLGESKETYMDSLGRPFLVVSPASARAGLDRFYCVDKDHFEICKPNGNDAAEFSILGGFLFTIQEERAQDIARAQENLDMLEWSDDPITWEKMCDPVKCSDGMTYDRWTIIDNGVISSPIDRTKLSILCDDTSLRSRLFTAYPEQESRFRERREKYRAEALQHAQANPIETKDAIEKFSNIIKWRPLDTECKNALDAMLRPASQKSPSVESVPRSQVLTSGIPVLMHEDVIRARGMEFETRLSTFLVFVCILIYFFIM